MANAAVLHLLAQVAHRAVLLVVQVCVDIELAHVMHQVEVEVFDLAFAQLLFEDFFDFAHVGQVIARELVGQVERVAWTVGQRTAYHQFGVAAVVAPGSIKVVHAVLEGVVEHFPRSRLVDDVVVSVDDRQAHAAHGHGRELFALEVTIDHAKSILSRLGRSPKGIGAAFLTARHRARAGFLLELYLLNTLEQTPRQIPNSTFFDFACKSRFAMILALAILLYKPEERSCHGSDRRAP